MLTIKLDATDQSILNELQSFLDALSNSDTSLPKLRVTLTGSVIRLLFQYQKLLHHAENDAAAKARLEKTASELNATSRDFCIEPLESNITLTLPQINQIAHYLAAKYNFPAPTLWGNHYHAQMERNNTIYHINLENTQKEPRNSVDAKTNQDGQIIFYPNFNVDNKSHEDLFSSHIVTMPTLQILLTEFPQRLQDPHLMRGYLSHLSYYLKSSIKPLRDTDYTLDEYTASTWAKFIQTSPAHYAMIKAHLKSKSAQNNWLVDVNPIELLQFETYVQKIYSDALERNEKEEKAALKAEEDKINKQARLEAKNIEAETNRLFIEYWRQRVQEIKSDKREIDGLFARLMTVYNFYLDEQYELEKLSNDDETAETDLNNNYFGLPIIMRLMDKSTIDYQHVQTLKEKINTSLVAIEAARQELKKMTATVEAQQQQEAQAAARAKQENKIAKQKTVLHASSSIYKKEAVISDAEDLDNIIVNRALECFSVELIAEFNRWGKTIAAGEEHNFIIKLSQKFAHRFAELLKTEDHQARFFGGLKSRIPSLANATPQLDSQTCADLLRVIIPYFDIDLEEYFKKENNLKAYIVNVFTNFRFMQLFSQTTETALTVMNSYILSHRYTFNEKIYQRIKDTYQEMESKGLFTREQAKTCAELSLAADSPGKRVGFKFTRNGCVIIPGLMQLFYENGKGKLLKKLDNEAENLIIFETIIFETLKAKLHESMSLGAEVPTAEIMHGYLLSYIEELEINNLGVDARIKNLRALCHKNKKGIMKFHDVVYNSLINISNNFTPQRILASIFDTDPEADEIMVYANQRYEKWCQQTGTDFMAVQEDECLFPDIEVTKFSKQVVHLIEHLATVWPNIYVSGELNGFSAICHAGSQRFFETIIAALANIPKDQRKNHKKDNCEKFWDVFDKIHEFYQSLTSSDPVQYYIIGVRIFREDKAYESALYFLNLALEGFKENKSPPIKIAVCYSTMASCYRELNKLEEAKEACITALKVCKENKLVSTEVANIQKKLTQIQDRLQDKSNASSSLSYI